MIHDPDARSVSRPERGNPILAQGNALGNGHPTISEPCKGVLTYVARFVLPNGWIALSGLGNSFVTWFPGRCPGLSQTAPLGLKNLVLSYALSTSVTMRKTPTFRGLKLAPPFS